MKLTHHAHLCEDENCAGNWKGFDATRTYPMPEPTTKPNGLWLSVDGDWRRWCEDEEMGGWITGPEIEFELVEPRRVLHLSTPEDVDYFTNTFVLAGPVPESLRDVDPCLHKTLRQYMIPWGKLAAEFSGILIAPYIWERRLHPHTSWYYGWDCASACIWDLSVLREVGPV